MTKIDLRGSGYDSTGYQPTEEVVDDKGQSFRRSSILSRPKANDSTSLTDRFDSQSGGDANLLQWANEYYLSGGGSGNGISGYRPDKHEPAGDDQGGGEKGLVEHELMQFLRISNVNSGPHLPRDSSIPIRTSLISV